MNKKALKGLKKEEEIKSKLRDTTLHIKDLEAELEFMYLREANEFKYITSLENRINKLYKKLEELNENN